MHTQIRADDDGGFKLYHYTPTFGGAVAFAVFFAIASGRHIQLLFKKRTWFFIPFIVGCLFETIGYAARAYSSKQTPDWTLMPYIIQSMLILLGPAFYAASIYMLLGRLVVLIDGEQNCLISTRWLTKIFLLGDILSIFGQGGGGGLLAASSSQSTQDMGNTIIMLGLGIQLVFFGGFMVVTVLFHIRMNRRPTVKSRGTLIPWKMFLYVLYVASMLIMVRSVFRLIEYAQGYSGALLQKEIYVYALDAFLMLLVSAIFAWYHPRSLYVHESQERYDMAQERYREIP
ncbi:unnamed protein product [Clonostachys rosea f. rosea IK726]|uniref:RTA1 like protein n=2 Tax=Bionectria ochroleuca TaxID=29856 RepID=A0A0B7JU54_BIOOC|nr:unnamed protein product [Clonostachys rosea f. rosea IK726]